MYCLGLGSSAGGQTESAEAGLQHTDTSVCTVQDWGAVQEDRLRLLKQVCGILIHLCELSRLGSSEGGQAEAAEAGLQYTDTSVCTVQDWGAVQEDRLRLLKQFCSTLIYLCVLFRTGELCRRTG